MIRLYEAKIFCQFDKMQNQKKPLFPPQDMCLQICKVLHTKEMKEGKKWKRGGEKESLLTPLIRKLEESTFES